MIPAASIKYENLVKGYDIADARNLKGLESYDAVAVDEEHNAVYLFKNENKSTTSKLGFVPVLEYATFIPDYIKELVDDFNRSVLALSRVEASVMQAEVVKQAVKDRLLLVKAEDASHPPWMGTTALTDIRSIDVNATAKDIVRKALIIYQKVWDKNMLLGAVIPTTQGTIVPQVPAPQPQGNFFQRLYGRASTWYTSLTNATKTRVKWFAGVMAAGAGAMGLTWLYSKSNKGSIPAA